jgi:hypothetical protein
MTIMPQIQILHHHDLNKKEALAVTERIKSKMGDLMSEIAQAWIGRAWIALDYESWADYIKGEFNHAPLALPSAERKAVTALLRGQGMSTRAIAPAFGVDQKTVVNDLSGEEFSSPDSEFVQVTGLDGKTYTVTCPQPGTAQPAPSQDTTTCPTCGGTGKVTQ